MAADPLSFLTASHPILPSSSPEPVEPGSPLLEAEPAGIGEEEPPVAADIQRGPQQPLYQGLGGLGGLAGGLTEVPQPAAPFSLRTRVLHALAGVVLTAVFLLPWNGARSWEMLLYLSGADFVRQLLFLVAGGIFLSTALLPVPDSFRAGTGAFLGFFALSLGGAMLSVWQTLLAVVVVTLLPAALILRVKLRQARLPKLMGLLAVLALLALYLVPRDGVPPLRVAVELTLYQSEDTARFIGTYLLLPVPLGCLAAVSLIGDDVAVIGELLSWLIFCWGPGAILVLALDRTQVYMAAAVLSYLVCASYGLADLLHRVVMRLEAPPPYSY